MEEGDYDDHNILVTDKETQNYESSSVLGIQSCYNMIAFRNMHESGEVNTIQTVYLRDGFCSCDTCRGAIKPDDYKNCRSHHLFIISINQTPSPSCSSFHFLLLYDVYFVILIILQNFFSNTSQFLYYFFTIDTWQIWANFD